VVIAVVDGPVALAWVDPIAVRWVRRVRPDLVSSEDDEGEHREQAGNSEQREVRKQPVAAQARAVSRGHHPGFSTDWTEFLGGKTRILQ
jgi:hypothetical protein